MIVVQLLEQLWGPVILWVGEGKMNVFKGMLLAASLLVSPQMAQAQVDCNQLARDLVKKDFQSSWSEYSKLLFLSMLSQMSVQEGQDTINRSGDIAVGP